MQVSLDYGAAREVVYSACKRAMAFMGYGMNAARDERLTDFSLSKEVNLSFLPPVLSPEQIAKSKNDFEQWIVLAGFRELIEAFGRYLDLLYHFSLLASLNGQAPRADFETRVRECENAGLPGKQLRLREQFGIISPHAGALKTLYEARNCLAHTLGVVTPEFFNASKCLELRWTIVELFGITEDGSERAVDLSPNAPATVLADGCLRKRVVTRARTYNEGQIVRLCVKELAEIVVFTYLAADSFLFPAVEYAKAKGVRDPSTPGQSHPDLSPGTENPGEHESTQDAST